MEKKRYVGPVGNPLAKIAIVGEGPGREELRVGEPFVGASGRQLNDLLDNCGLTRSDVYITNVIKWSDEKPNIEEIKEATVALTRELASLEDCNVVIALGGLALFALSGGRYESILRYRGSILETYYGQKMVPTLHPAWYMRGAWQWKPVVLADFERAVKQSAFPEIRRAERRYVLEPTFEQAMEGIQQLWKAKELTVDIETFGRWIGCVGIASGPDYALCIPFLRSGMRPYWSQAMEAVVWRELAKLLASDIPKIFQNGMFDISKLAEHGVQVRNFHSDTMLAHHLLLPELPHGLDFIGSIYSEEPYYKDEGKKWNPNAHDRQLWQYNLKDCTTTCVANTALRHDLVEAGMIDYFDDYVMRLPVPILEMQRWGMMVDKTKLGEVSRLLRLTIDTADEDLAKLIGRRINVKSPTDCLWLLGRLGIKPTRFTPTGRPKVDEESLRVYAGREHSEIFNLVFLIREKRTVLEGFLNIVTDDNDIYHPSYLIHGTKSGRLSARGDGLGPQPQNVPEFARKVFVARPGYVFLNFDYKQAEAMIVAYLARDDRMIDFFTTGKDVHRFLASIFFNKPEPEISKKPERHVAKRIGHGSNYRMGPNKIVAVLRNEGIYLNEREASRYQSQYYSTFNRIPVWHMEVEDTVKRTRTLQTCFGRKRVFLGVIDDAAVREAISYIPQATAVECTNRALIELHETLRSIDGHITAQVHDSLLLEVPPDKVSEAKALVKKAMTRPLHLPGGTLTIPIEAAIGDSWGTLEECEFDG